MGFRNGAYATVWEMKPGNGNWTNVKLSISKRSRQSGEYETDFSGFVRFIGDAHTNAAYLGERVRIKIGECDVTNRYDRDKEITYTNYAVFSFKNEEGNNSSSEGNKQNSDGFMRCQDDSELPFN